MDKDKPTDARAQPFVGIEPFRIKDKPFFAGREKEIADVSSQFFRNRLTILYGSSGVGKTSLLYAGVIPDLRSDRDDVAVVPFRSWQTQSFETALRESLFKALLPPILKLLKANGQELASCDDSNLEELKNRLRTLVTSSEKKSDSQPEEEDVLYTLPFSELVSICCSAFGGRIFFIFDQFEEYFLYHPPSDKIEFEKELAITINDSKIPASFLISLRDDGFSKIDRLTERVPSLMANPMRLEHLTAEGARYAILEPIAEYNRRLEGEETALPKVIPPDQKLIDAICNDASPVPIGVSEGELESDDFPVSDGGERRHVDTFQLQLVMSTLWEKAQISEGNKFTLESYKERGRARGILAGFIEDRLGSDLRAFANAGFEESKHNPESELSDEKFSEIQEDVATILGYLITNVGSKKSISTRGLSDVTTFNKERTSEILGLLKKTRIVREVDQDVPPDERRWEFKHDAIALHVRPWREKILQRKAGREAEERKAVAIAKAEAATAVAEAKIVSAKAAAEREKVVAEAKIQRARDSAEAEKSDAKRKTLVAYGVSITSVFIAVIGLFAFWIFEQKAAKESLETDKTGLHIQRLADNSRFFYAKDREQDDMPYVVPFAIHSMQLILEENSKTNTSENLHNQQLEFPFEALVGIRQVTPFPLPSDESDPTDFISSYIPAFETPDRKFVITLDSEKCAEGISHCFVWDYLSLRKIGVLKFPELPELEQDRSTFRVTEFNFSGGSERFTIVGHIEIKNEAMEIVKTSGRVYSWALDEAYENQNKLRDSPVAIQIRPVNELDVKQRSHIGKPVPFESDFYWPYTLVKIKWVADALAFAKPMDTDQQESFPVSMMGIGKHDVQNFPSERLKRLRRKFAEERGIADEKNRTAVDQAVKELDDLVTQLVVGKATKELNETQKKVKDEFRNRLRLGMLASGSHKILPEDEFNKQNTANAYFLIAALLTRDIDLDDSPIDLEVKKEIGKHLESVDSWGNIENIAKIYSKSAWDAARKIRKGDYRFLEVLNSERDSDYVTRLENVKAEVTLEYSKAWELNDKFIDHFDAETRFREIVKWLDVHRDLFAHLRKLKVSGKTLIPENDINSIPENDINYAYTKLGDLVASKPVYFAFPKSELEANEPLLDKDDVLIQNAIYLIAQGDLAARKHAEEGGGSDTDDLKAVEAALAFYREAVKLHPPFEDQLDENNQKKQANAHLNIGKGNRAVMDGEINKAAQLYINAGKLVPELKNSLPGKEALSLISQGNLFALKGEEDEAIEKYREAIKKDTAVGILIPNPKEKASDLKLNGKRASVFLLDSKKFIVAKDFASAWESIHAAKEIALQLFAEPESEFSRTEQGLRELAPLE